MQLPLMDADPNEIEVFYVYFGKAGGNAADVAKSCASAPENFIEASNTQELIDRGITPDWKPAPPPTTTGSLSPRGAERVTSSSSSTRGPSAPVPDQRGAERGECGGSSPDIWRELSGHRRHVVSTAPRRGTRELVTQPSASTSRSPTRLSSWFRVTSSAADSGCAGSTARTAPEGGSERRAGDDRTPLSGGGLGPPSPLEVAEVCPDVIACLRAIVGRGASARSLDSPP